MARGWRGDGRVRRVRGGHEEDGQGRAAQLSRATKGEGGEEGKGGEEPRGEGGAGGSEDAPAEEAAKASAADDEVFLDDELEFESDDEGDENAAPGNSDAEGPEEGPEDDDGDDFFAPSDDDDDDDDGPHFAPLASTYRVDESLALGPSLLVPKPEPVLAFVPAFDVRSGSSSNPNPNPKPSMDPRVLDVVSGDDGARAGEWHVFDNGVAFVPDHGVPLHLVLGVNVAAIDVHDALVDADGVADAAAGPVVVFRLSRPCALAPSHLFLRDDDDAGTSRLNGTTSVAFSLAPLGDKSKRHFARVVVPRWRRVCASGHRRGWSVTAGPERSSGARFGPGWARTPPPRRRRRGRADAPGPRGSARAGSRSRRRRRPREASVAHKRFQTREPDSAVLAAASALDAELYTGTGKHVPSRGFEQQKETGDEGGSMTTTPSTSPCSWGRRTGARTRCLTRCGGTRPARRRGSPRRRSRRAQPRNPCASSPTRSRRSDPPPPEATGGARGSRIGCASSRGRTSPPRRWRRR